VARAKKSKAAESKPKDEVIDVVAVDVTPEELPTDEVVEEVVEAPEPDVPEETPEIVEEQSTQDTSENASDEPPVLPPVAPIVVKRVGFFPLVFGGIAAAGIGFAAASVVAPSGWPFSDARQEAFNDVTTANVKAQSATLSGLQSQITDLAAQTNTADIKAAMVETTDSIAALQGQMAAISAKMNDLQFRLTDLEKRPITEGISDAAIAAFEGELKSVQDAMAAQRAEIEAATAAATQMETNAQISQTETLKRAALSQIQTALNVGTEFSGAVANLQAVGENIPQALVVASKTGVPSIAALQEAFPVAARLALSKAQQSGANEDGGFGAFLRNQLGARSLDPKEGNSTDAILSRAEAALGEGRLLDATAELQGLPEVAQAAMAGWLSDVTKRQNALAAVEVLGQQLNSN